MGRRKEEFDKYYNLYVLIAIPPDFEIFVPMLGELFKCFPLERDYSIK